MLQGSTFSLGSNPFNDLEELEITSAEGGPSTR